MPGMGWGSAAPTKAHTGCAGAARLALPHHSQPSWLCCRLETFPLFSCGPRGAGVVAGGVGCVPSWGFVWDPTEAPQDVGSSNAPPLTPQHCTESKMPSLLHRADSLSVLGAELNIYLLLHHPQITLLWGVVIKPLMQYSGSLTAYEDRLKERGQYQIFDCMMSAPEEKCNNQKISTLRNSLLVNKSHADGTN